ncbi:hypothetical protein Dda_6523 [Drechslerella dactyloides]|uniref:PHD-type domain-containing protein n=1 Tax=Drechslerella dactyloides TaxID=74499 RepID=A0AAD6IXH6_DREDA|nr:hypothetical protein Dda_6523 [Drechslerella dactyloides]
MATTPLPKFKFRLTPMKAGSDSPASTAATGTTTKPDQEGPPARPRLRIILRTGKRKITEVEEQEKLEASAPKRHRKKARKAARRGDNKPSPDENYSQNGAKTKSGRPIITPGTTTSTKIQDIPQKDGLMKSSVPRPQVPSAPAEDDIDTACTVCKSTQDSQGNEIVLCDGCDAAYHQACHLPAIDNSFVQVAEKSWFCGRCAPSSALYYGAAVESKYSPERMTGESLSLTEKYDYFYSLPRSALISLVRYCEELAPGIPLFPVNLKEVLASFEPVPMSDRCHGANPFPPLPRPVKRRSLPPYLVKVDPGDEGLWEDDSDNPGISHIVNGVLVHPRPADKPSTSSGGENKSTK